MIRNSKRWFVTFHEAELPVSHTPYWVIEVEAQKEVRQDCGEYEYRSVEDMTGFSLSAQEVEKFLNTGRKDWF